MTIQKVAFLGLLKIRTFMNILRMRSSTFLTYLETGEIRASNQLVAPSEIFHVFFSTADFFQNQLFRKILSGIPSGCQTDWIQIRPDILSGLICVRTVCKGYKQTILVGCWVKNYFFFPSHYRILNHSKTWNTEIRKTVQSFAASIDVKWGKTQ